MNIRSPDNYIDQNSLAGLKNKARNNDPESSNAVAKQFESLFIQIMLKSMRETDFGGDIFGGSGTEMYRDMMDKQMSVDLSSGKGIGIAEVLAKQIDDIRARQSGSLSDAVGHMSTGGVESKSAHEPKKLPSINIRENHAVMSDKGREAPVGESVMSAAHEISSPEEFVRVLWNDADAAAKSIGVDTRMLLAQAALETGWGKKIIKNADGTSSFNLFGIKAGKGWEGKTATVPTIEYENGVAVRKRDAFRSYNSPRESFADYVNFLKSNPRYADALKSAHNGEEFVRKLQDAGYATDPSYAKKISAIASGDRLNNALSSAS